MTKRGEPPPNRKPSAAHITHITNIMADGSVKDSVEGYEVPVNPYTELCYELLARFSKMIGNE